MDRFKLPRAHQQILREQVIGEVRPGTILRDFRMVLDFVGTKGVPASGKYNLLPIESLDELNRRLSRPLQFKDMKRPLLRSNPYLQGLHLLLRATGLGMVQGTGAKARLTIDPALWAAWDRLNPTEQFFTLLEAWFRFGRAEMIGQRRSRFKDILLTVVATWKTLPRQGMRFNLDRPNETYLFGVGQDHYLLALMDLFGLLEVVHPDRPLKPWMPAGIGHLPFGDALLNLLAGREIGYLYSRFAESEAGEADAEDDSKTDEGEGEKEGEMTTPRFGDWQRLFQPYFPEWRDNLILPQAAARAGVFIFRVALGKVWRRIAMPADGALDLLVTSVLQAFDFDNDHLYAFIYRDRFGKEIEVHHPYLDEGPWTDEVRVGEIPLEPGQSMKLMYDFGGGWLFNVLLEGVEPPGTKVKAPRILEKHGKAPEQYDSGGW